VRTKTDFHVRSAGPIGDRCRYFPAWEKKKEKEKGKVGHVCGGES